MSIHTEIFNYIWHKIATYANLQKTDSNKNRTYSFNDTIAYTEGDDRYLMTDTLNVCATWQGKLILEFEKGSTLELSDLFNQLCP